MKSNPYVYPTVPFKNLNNKKVIDNFIREEEIDIGGLKKEIRRIKQPIIENKGRSAVEKILNIFLDKNFIFGPRYFIKDDKNFWHKKLNYFIENKKPINFTILGFPFKVPVFLKTNRTFPDMGEVLILLRLKTIIENIKKIYSPGAVIYIFTEGGLGPFCGVNKEDYEGYEKFLIQLSKDLNFNEVLKIEPLSNMEKISGFRSFFLKRLKENRKLFKEKNKAFLVKYKGAFPSIFKIINTKMYDEIFLMDVYNEKLKNNEISEQAMKIRKHIEAKSDECICNYFAYLKARDDINYLEKIVPNYIPLSVSPKPKRLGILPINKECNILPYHGVPVLNKDSWTIEYLIDIRRSKEQYIKMFLKNDKEKKPFYYEIKSV